jgi:hypothetical protein
MEEIYRVIQNLFSNLCQIRIEVAFANTKQVWLYRDMTVTRHQQMILKSPLAVV